MLFIKQLTVYASAESAEKDVLGALGIDFPTLAIQILAFLVFFAVLAKFVYPPLLAMLDKRDKLITESMKAALEAEKNAAESEAKTAALMKKARKQADELLEGAKAEASAMVSEAESKSQKRADQIMKDAESEIARSVAEARKSLRDETISLVAEATEKVVGKAMSSNVDKKIVAAAVKEVEA